MEFEADRMTGLVLTEANVPPERDVVLEEYNMRVANSPEARLGEQVAAALYLNHPYGRPVIGWRPELEKLNREDALAFYRRFYTPNNAVLVIAGDVNVDEVRRLAEKTYGKVAARAEIGPRMRPQEPAPVAVRQVTLADPRVAQPSLQRSYLVPSSTTGKAGEPEALKCSRMCSATARRAGSTVPSWSSSISQPMQVAGIRAPPSTRRASASTPVRCRGSRSPPWRRRSTP